ncbi:MAG: hypothetical protein HUU50_21545 [Candidatus Brocadiae bacterium]|nr:hypothetical protein [Candidatus Brocadiia bacterium]
MNNQFITEFEGNINFFYNCFDRVILKGYVRWLFTASALSYFLKLLGFHKASQGVMRILTDQLNKHISPLF